MAPASPASKKRKRHASATHEGGVPPFGAISHVLKENARPGPFANTAPSAGGKKAPEAKSSAPFPFPSKKAKRKAAGEFAESQFLARNICKSSAAEQASWLFGQYAAATKASPLELDGLGETAFASPTCGGSLDEQLTELAPVLSQSQRKAARQYGRPLVVTVAQSAVAASHYVKYFQGHHQVCRIAKLFAKHFKEVEQKEYLAKHMVDIVTGTPNRLCKLADRGALDLEEVELLVLDASIDAKERSLLSNPEVSDDFWKLFETHLSSRVRSGLP